MIGILACVLTLMSWHSSEWRTESNGSHLIEGSAAVLERQQQPRAICLHFAALDLQVQFHNFGDPQITQRTRSGFYRIFPGVLPGFRARTDHLDDLVD